MKALTLLTALSLLVATFSFGCQRRQHDPEKAYKMLTYFVDDALDEIDASDAQREEINAVKDELFDSMLTFKANSKASKTLLAEELMRDTPDAQKMHDEVDAWIEEARAMAHEAVDASLKVHGTLSPEQRENLTEMIKSHAD